jgi:hypothetical protein
MNDCSCPTTPSQHTRRPAPDSVSWETEAYLTLEEMTEGRSQPRRPLLQRLRAAAEACSR